MEFNSRGKQKLLIKLSCTRVLYSVFDDCTTNKSPPPFGENNVFPSKLGSMLNIDYLRGLCTSADKYNQITGHRSANKIRYRIRFTLVCRIPRARIRCTVKTAISPGEKRFFSPRRCGGGGGGGRERRISFLFSAFSHFEIYDLW